MKIQIKTPLWNFSKGDIVDVSKENAEFAIRKGYAEKVDEKRKTKVETADKTK